MALRDLSTAQMVERTAAILEPDSPARRVLSGVDGGAALLTQIQRAYDGLIAAQPPPNTALAKLVQELALHDARHDACVRGLLGRLESEIVFAEDDESRGALEAVRDALFPSRASVVQVSYVDEAGEGKLREARITPAMRRLLGKLKLLDGRTGETIYGLLQSSARALGEGEAKRAELGGAGDVVTKTHLARLQWMRVINSVSAFLAAEGIDEREVLGAIRDAEVKAGRARERDTDPGVTPAPAPSGDEPAS